MVKTICAGLLALAAWYGVATWMSVFDGTKDYGNWDGVIVVTCLLLMLIGIALSGLAIWVGNKEWKERD